MLQLSSAGQQAINDVAQRHGFSFDAVLSMLESVINGNGSMAQFSHPEFGGSGQWMQGGMTMIGDMFNNYLKGRVDGLCAELARLISNQPGLIRTGSFQSQTQNGQTSVNSWGGMGSSIGDTNSTTSLFVPAPVQADWWGPELRWPNSTGGQNGLRYAWFAQARRLAIESNGQVIVYDTLDHQIGGVSQQQGTGASATFTSQYGYVDLQQLPVVTVNGVPAAPVMVPPAVAPSYSTTSFSPLNSGTASQSDIFSSIEKLAALQSRGILSQQEFAAKKADLLSRL